MTIHTLEQQFADLIGTHGLASISLSVIDHGHIEGVSFYAYAQAVVGDVRLCGSTGADGLPIAEAIAAAISDLNAKRHPVIAVELAPMGEAA